MSYTINKFNFKQQEWKERKGPKKSNKFIHEGGVENNQQLMDHKSFLVGLSRQNVGFMLNQSIVLAK